MPGLGKHYRLRAGDFCVVTGIPSHGKTSFVDDVCCLMAQNHGWGTAFASFEQRPQIDHRRALRTWRNRKTPDYQSEAELREADEWIERNFAFICPTDEDDVDLNWVLGRTAAAIVRYGVKIVVIDPWNEMDHVRPDGVSLTEYTGIAIKMFRRLARKYQIHLIVVAHPTKMPKEKDGQIVMPNPYDIADSAAWYNKSDVCVIVHRVDKTTTVIRVAKSRYHDKIGVPGEIRATYCKPEHRFMVHEDLLEDVA